ncbi:MAG: type II toxin-antitoxin system RelE/ParE family toxin [Lachnospiraceae bacterium]|nr:type II toxin-antitoxin system RelE/ParE family toxin [Lachnospiraceae bacterium]
MKYRIHYTPTAQKDMDAVWDGVLEASASYDVSDEYVGEFADKIASKGDFPESGIPLCYRGLFTGFYSINIKAYKAFYRIKDGYIEVVRVLPAKMEYMKLLFGESEL